MSTKLVERTNRLTCDRQPVGCKAAVLADRRPPVRTTSVATRHHAERPADEAAQLAYSEWLLAKLVA